jgi:hypothetical protein
MKNLERFWKKRARPYQHNIPEFATRYLRTPRKISVKISRVMAEIQAENLPKMRKKVMGAWSHSVRGLEYV